MKPALEIQQLTKIYGEATVVKGISLSVAQGEIFGLLGPNGAGKSTTINMVTGVTNITSGKAYVHGFDVQSQFIESRRRVGVMHQELVIDTFFTIDKALEIHSGYYGVPDDPKWRNLLIERLALGPHLKKSMNRLSGGMKRRFMVAKALIHKPRVLILDEPTAGVDVELRRNLWDFVLEMNQKEGTTILLTTHYLEEAEEMCKRVAIMNNGSVVAMEETKKLLSRIDEKKILVHVREPLAHLPESLGSLDCELLENGLVLSFPVNAKHSPNHILHCLSETKIHIQEIETRTPSLQDAFLKLTSSHKGAHV